ncbi:4Fe-4S dicluster domain-containing protein [Crenalkalicoccus roseus]|uniref:4Fe-4S dicluster domain-containing protein n=1 Tax=Crenalkalicoccus roseus TaxID=1485588 RepID=UPI0010809B0A|nr:4Fe-4S dicluster domain-containing protein [Crenalkalicoccus roseus]
MEGGLAHRRALDYADRDPRGPIPQEAEITTGRRVEPGRAYGFFTDTTLCIGCKACEVACKEWNQLPADHLGLTGHSYDNTGHLGAHTWRHVTFNEKIGKDGRRATTMPPYQSHWLMMSDVCKHCDPAPCLEACPTGALFRTEFESVVVQQDICNGCGYCVPACPFGVVELSVEDGKAHKCTLCYDRLKGGLEPACAKSCPTDSIRFGPVEELLEGAKARVARLHAQGQPAAYLYGAPGTPRATGGIGRLNAFFLLIERPEAYNLPPAPSRPAPRALPSILSGLAAVAGLAAAALLIGVGRR